MNNILGLVLGIVYIAVIIKTSSFFKKFGKEFTRKYIHILLANWWIILLVFCDNVIIASILPVLFVIINYLSYKFNLIKTMERDENDGLGTVYYAISLLVLVIYTYQIINKPWIGLCGVLVMGYGDGLASVIGKKIKSKKYKIGNSEKSIAGSLTMFVITYAIIAIVFGVNLVSGFAWKALIIAALATIIEAFSIKGTDNLTVPILVSIISNLFTII